MHSYLPDKIIIMHKLCNVEKHSRDIPLDITLRTTAILKQEARLLDKLCITDAVKQFGMTSKTLRYYERIGDGKLYGHGATEECICLYHGNHGLNHNYAFGINMDNYSDTNLSAEAISFHQPIFRGKLHLQNAVMPPHMFQIKICKKIPKCI